MSRSAVTNPRHSAKPFPLSRDGLALLSGSGFREEGMMLWKGIGRAAVAAALILVAAAPAWASNQGLGFSASVGLEITYAPVPPAAYNVGSDLRLGFEVPGFALQSETRFDLTDFTFQRVVLVVDLGLARISEDVRFEPEFDWNELSFDLCFVGVELGIDWIFADISIVQTPSYDMGIVLSFETEIPCGLGFASVTGFGAVDLVSVLGGAEAPFSQELLSLFLYVDRLCVEAPELDVTVVEGLFFEEELLRLTFAFEGLLASHSTWFDASGLSQMVFELGYSFDDPSLGFLIAINVDGTFSVSAIDIVLDLAIGGVHFTSWTGFAEPVFPLPVPVIFAGQAFAVSFELCGVTLTSETDFTDLFLFEAEIIAIEAAIDPFTFVSVTTFDDAGFASQCIEAGVSFAGVHLSTKAQFTWDGIELVSFGFELTF